MPGELRTFLVWYDLGFRDDGDVPDEIQALSAQDAAKSFVEDDNQVLTGEELAHWKPEHVVIKDPRTGAQETFEVTCELEPTWHARPITEG